MSELELKHEIACDKLSQLAAEWIVSQLQGTKGTRFRGATELESSIYGWLLEHAIFKDKP